jgi:hypothetical protein
MDLKVAGTKRKIQIAELKEWREKAVTQCQAIQGNNQKVARQANQDQVIQAGR